MSDFTKINAADIQLGMRYSAPVFFDDGKNMFLAEGKSIKNYHIAAIKQWHISTLLSYGHVVSGVEASTGMSGSGGKQRPSLLVANEDDIEELGDLEVLD